MAGTGYRYGVDDQYAKYKTVVIFWFRRNILLVHLLALLTVVLLVAQWGAAGLLAGALYVCAMGTASMRMGTNLFLDSYRRLLPAAGSGGQIALTFDDSPTEGTAAVLDILRAHQVKATFFIVGRHALQRPELLQRIVAEGHAIGNHSFSHAHTLPMRPAAVILADMRQCSQAILDIVGVTPTMYRPPFGVVNPGISQAVQSMGLPCVGWSVRSFDTAIRQPRRLLRRIVSRIGHDDIVLLHDYPAVTPQILPELLQEIRRRDLQCVVLSPDRLAP